jgi:hypothetical protein
MTLFRLKYQKRHPHPFKMNLKRSIPDPHHPDRKRNRKTYFPTQQIPELKNLVIKYGRVP